MYITHGSVVRSTLLGHATHYRESRYRVEIVNGHPCSMHACSKIGLILQEETTLVNVVNSNETSTQQL